MERLAILIFTALALGSFNKTVHPKKVLNGIVTDGYRNGLVAIHAMIKGTPNGNVTNACGQFSIPVDADAFTLVFQGMFYDDWRTYEIRLEKSQLTSDTIVFQLGYRKVNNPDCKKASRKLKRLVIE